jgi:hypothetical protein
LFTRPGFISSEYLELKDKIDKEELDDGDPKDPWLLKERAPKSTSVVSKSKGKAVKSTGAAALASSSKEIIGSGETTAFILTAIY